MNLRAALVLASVLALPLDAHADIAPPGPGEIECPLGAIGTVPTVRPDALDPRGRPVRAWPYCAPSTCASDADCTEGRVCSPEEIGLCVEDHPVEGGEPVRNARARGCEPDNSCLNIESTCERARRCVPPAAAPTTPPVPEPPPAPAPAAAETAPSTESPAAASGGCACHASERRVPGASLLLALLPLALVARRRRR